MNRLASATIVLLVVAFGCDGHTSFSGKVVGLDGQPIEGVEVRLREVENPGRNCTRVSDKSGQYSLGLTHAPVSLSLEVTATKAGFKTFRKRFQSRQRNEVPETIVLEPTPEVGEQAN
jgi:hypothetical protein